MTYRDLGVDSLLQKTSDRLVSQLIDYIRIPSVSMTGDGIDQAVEFIKKKMASCGFSINVFKEYGLPIVYGEIGPEDASVTMLMYGHYDVFPAKDQAGWKTNPFEPVLDGDRIWGRGAGDNKGQHLAHINAIGLFQEITGDLPIRIKLIIEGEEETGSKALKAFVTNHQDLLKADFCFYSDGPMFPDDQPVLLLGVRGILCLELAASGAERPLHSGNFGGVAPNPALTLCRLLASMLDDKGNIKIPGAGVTNPSENDQKAIAALPLDLKQISKDIGVAPVTGKNEYAFYERLLLKPNFNLAGFSSGYTGDGIKTVIPNEAIAKIDIRLVGQQDPDQVLEAIKGFIDSSGHQGITLKKLVAQPPSKTPMDHPCVGIIKQAVAEGFGVEPLIVPSLGGTTPDYVFTKILGIPSIVVPLAPYDENNHAPNESTKVSTFLNGIKSTIHLLLSMAAANPASVSDSEKISLATKH